MRRIRNIIRLASGSKRLCLAAAATVGIAAVGAVLVLTVTDSSSAAVARPAAAPGVQRRHARPDARGAGVWRRCGRGHVVSRRSLCRAAGWLAALRVARAGGTVDRAVAGDSGRCRLPAAGACRIGSANDQRGLPDAQCLRPCRGATGSAAGDGRGPWRRLRDRRPAQRGALGGRRPRDHGRDPLSARDPRLPRPCGARRALGRLRAPGPAGGAALGQAQHRPLRRGSGQRDAVRPVGGRGQRVRRRCLPDRRRPVSEGHRSESAYFNYNVNTIWSTGDCKSQLQTEREAQDAGATFADKVGCGGAGDVAACLRAVPVQTLIDNGGKVLDPTGGGTIGPIVNGTTLPELAGDSDRQGTSERHPPDDRGGEGRVQRGTLRPLGDRERPR